VWLPRQVSRVCVCAGGRAVVGGRLISYFPTCCSGSCSCHPPDVVRGHRGRAYADFSVAGSVYRRSQPCGPASGGTTSNLPSISLSSHTLPEPESNHCRRFLETPTHAFLIGECGIWSKSGWCSDRACNDVPRLASAAPLPKKIIMGTARSRNLTSFTSLTQT
jgi:hypothetical protein